jgi:uncharacterized protein (TIGR00725 family)
MDKSRAKAIIAVFGGDNDKAVDCAKRLGAAIADRKQILLTGGKGPGSHSVKESAIKGAGSSPWIGVHRPGSIPKQADCYEKDSGFVIVSDLDHKRNYLEAALCDAAIGLTGEKGTYSEIVFALSLHRLVALIGKNWMEKWPVNLEKRPEEAVSTAMERVGTVANDRPLLRKLLNEETILLGLKSLPADRFRYFGSEDDVNPENVVGWILRAVEFHNGLVHAGRLPSIEGYEHVKTPYDKWLAKVAV